MKSTQLLKRPVYFSDGEDMGRITADKKAFLKLSGKPEIETKFEVGNNTLFDLMHSGKEITEQEYNA
jgi:hypothetical protein